MRLLYITVRFPVEPVEQFLIPELRELERLGHEIVIVPLRPKGQRRRENSHRYQRVHAPHLLSPRILRQAVKELWRRHAPVESTLRVIATQGAGYTRLKNLCVIPKGLYLGHWAKRWRVDHIHAYWASTPATAAMIAGAVSGIPWTFTAHRGDLSEPNLLAAKLSAASGARIISESGRQLLRDGLSRESLSPDRVSELIDRVRLLHLGVEVPAERSERPIVPTVLCPASLLPIKGHAYLLDAFRLVVEREPAARLLLAGAGPLLRPLRRQADELGITRAVDFLGHVEREQLLARYARSEISCCVLPSVVLGPGDYEGIPVSLMEAMSHGVPVISTATGGIPELLEGGAGLLVPERDPIALAGAIQRLLADERFWWEVATAGAKRIDDRFAVRGSTRELLSLISSGPRPR